MVESRWRVAVFGPLLGSDAPEAHAAIAAAGGEIVIAEPGETDAVARLTEDDIIADAAGAQIVTCMGLAPFTERVIASLPTLRFIQRSLIGYDRIDLEAATRHGVMVANSPLFCIEEVSDHAAMLILACARRLPHQQSALREHGWSRDRVVEAMGPTFRLRGRTLGFVAFGRIARLTAAKLRGFGMTYLAYDPYLPVEQIAEHGAEPVSLDELCRRSDIVSMHALLSAETRAMFGEAQLRAMRPTACFVNTSRGATVDEAALIRALREGWIAGAGLDVLAQEPPEPGNPLLTMANVIVTPHLANVGEDGTADNRVQSTEEIVRVLRGERPRWLLNPAALDHPRWVELSREQSR